MLVERMRGVTVFNLKSNDVYTVSFHKFKSQNFKLSVSNPKSESVACLSVLSQISNCQGLGRRNKFEIMKTDRMDTPQRLQHKVMQSVSYDSVLCYSISYYIRLY